MRSKSKLRTTIRNRTRAGRRVRSRELVGRRLPRQRPPTRPGEMLLEEFIKPLAITQSELAARLGISFPRLNEIIRGKRSNHIGYSTSAGTGHGDVGRLLARAAVGLGSLACHARFEGHRDWSACATTCFSLINRLTSRDSEWLN